MHRYSISRQSILTVLIILSFQAGLPTVGAQQDISTDLERAESLYYGAQFEESINLLLDLEKRLGDDPQRAGERLKMKLTLGLAYLGSNQSELAKARFVEVCVLDDKYELNAQDFSSKVIALFQEAKASCAQNYCSEICARISALIAEAKFDAAQSQFEAVNNPCPCAAAAAAAISQGRFRQGLLLYDQGDFAGALKQFNAVLVVDVTNALAREYSKLSQQRLELGVQLAYSDWRSNFDSRQFEKAAASYEQIRTSNIEPVATQLAGQIAAEYDRVLTGMVSSWKAACASGDPSKMDAIRKEASNFASGVDVARRALAEMGNCVQKTCLQGDPVLAVNRLKTRVNPEIDPSLRRYISRGIRVAIQIEEDGSVKVKRVTNTNVRLAEALKNAVEQWRFYPAIVDNQARCVQTELPINLIQP